MKIVNKQMGNGIEILEISGSLTGHGAIDLEEYLFKALDEERYHFIKDMYHVTAIDGIGISVLEKFLHRGMHFRFINVRQELRIMFIVSNKSELLDLILNEIDAIHAVSLFEREIREVIAHKEIKRRNAPRIFTSIPAKLFYETPLSREITGRSKITNLSEKGAYLEEISCLVEKNGESVLVQTMSGSEIQGIQFPLAEENSGSIYVQVKRIREKREKNNYCMGIDFIHLDKDTRNMIREYIYHVL